MTFHCTIHLILNISKT